MKIVIGNINGAMTLSPHLVVVVHEPADVEGHDVNKKERYPKEGTAARQVPHRQASEVAGRCGFGVFLVLIVQVCLGGICR